MTIKEKVSNWFTRKYDVDGERLQLIEHKGEDVIHFISEYIKDNDLGPELRKTMSEILVSKCWVRSQYSIPKDYKEHVALSEKNFDLSIKHTIHQGIVKELDKENRITIEKKDDIPRNQVVYEASIIVMDRDQLKDVVESFVTLMPEWKIKELRGND